MKVTNGNGFAQPVASKILKIRKENFAFKNLNLKPGFCKCYSEVVRVNGFRKKVFINFVLIKYCTQ